MKPQLTLVEGGAAHPLDVPPVETVTARIVHARGDHVRLALSFDQAWERFLPRRVTPSGNLYGGGLFLGGVETDAIKPGIYTRQGGLRQDDTLRYALHSRFVGRQLKAGSTIPLLMVNVGTRGVLLTAVGRPDLDAVSAGRAAHTTAQPRANPQGSLPLDVPPAGNLIEQLRIALSNVNGIAADIPGCVLRIEDGRVRAGVEL